jgi:hypothetical protein
MFKKIKLSLLLIILTSILVWCTNKGNTNNGNNYNDKNSNSNYQAVQPDTLQSIPELTPLPTPSPSPTLVLFLEKNAPIASPTIEILHKKASPAPTRIPKIIKELSKIDVDIDEKKRPIVRYNFSGSDSKKEND